MKGARFLEMTVNYTSSSIWEVVELTFSIERRFVLYPMCLILVHRYIKNRARESSKLTPWTSRASEGTSSQS